MRDWLMIKNVRIALIILLAAVLTGAVFAGIGKWKQDNAGAAGKTPSSSVSGKAHTASGGEDEQKPRRTVYPIGKWEIAIPFINPFGSQENYASVELMPNQYKELRYVNADNMEATRMTAGDMWKLQVEWSDSQTDPIDDLKLYIAELGGDFFRGSQESEWLMNARDDKGERWWGIAAQSAGGYALTVYKELSLRHGESLDFQTADYGNATFYFMTSNDNGKYQSIKASLPDGEARLLGKGAYEQGQYRRELYYNKTLSAYKATSYTLGDIPQDISAPILWEVSWSGNTAPARISLTLDEGEAIAPFQDGERLGALKVSGAALGSIKVEAAPGVTMSHPELNLKGDKTPEGDTLFWLPAGYWNVVAEPGDKKSVQRSMGARLVPVSAGEMTVLDVAPLVNESYRNAEIGNASGEENELRIERIAEQGDEAKVSFMLLDAQSPKFAPSLDDIEIAEGGEQGKPIRLERLQTPPSVVLALDSSGSMTGSMGQVLESARAFIEGLPDQTFIQVIDFDSQVRLLPGVGKTEVLESLKQVKAQGATALYDSIMMGLELLNDKERPTLVVFSDGVDSNTEGKGSGSKASKPETSEAVRQSGIPLFTIGFGPDHDDSTLLEMAAMSEGTYYSAKDGEALNHVFTSINDRLGNHFELTYERPKEQAPSDIPVISLTLDISGSMDVDPETGYGDYRLDKVKHLFHEFIGAAADNSLMQLVSFSSEIKVEQVFTSRKAELLQSLGQLSAGGGTDIFNSAYMTYQSLKKIPSDKRVIVYLTDAALDVEESQKETFEQLLGSIKEDGIQVLWVGLGTEESEEAFKWAAEKSGGSYVISENPDVLAKAFQQALTDVGKKRAEKIPLSLTINNRSGEGAARQYSANALTDFPAKPDSGNKTTLRTMNYRSGGKATQYEAETASLVYGRDIPSEEVKIYKRIPLGATGHNEAIEWTAREMYLMKRLKGVDAPSHRVFAAVDVELKNIHPRGAKYIIPDFAAHFFMSVNASGSYPASTATWLAETPLAPPGEGAISIGSGDTARGVLIFLVPDETVEQASLHFYDIEHGHISLSLAGKPWKEDVELASLPTSATGKLSDTFQMTATGSGLLEKVGHVELSGKPSVFHVVDAELKSNVQADMKFDPQQRFYLNVGTDKGPFQIPVNTATALLPHGLLRPVTLAPGSSNKARLAFQLPNALKDNPSELYVDLFGGAAVIPVNGAVHGASGEGSAGVFEGDGVTLHVHALSWSERVESGSGRYAVADVTVVDAPDGFGTAGFYETFRLVPGKGSSEQSVEPLLPDKLNDGLLLGIGQDWAVFDGMSRRGIVVFSVPRQLEGHDWTLQSDLFKELRLPVEQKSYSEEGLLVKRVAPELDSRFDIQLSSALTEAISKYKAMAAADEASPSAQVVKVGGSAGSAEQVPAPLPTVHGYKQLNAVESLEAFHKLLEQLQWLPSSDQYYYYRNSPETVLTQGWGTEGDLAHLAGGLLAKLGYSPSLRMVRLTDEGREALRKLGGIEDAKQQYLPAWAYTDEAGAFKLFVVPFMKDLSELGGLAFLPGGQNKRNMIPVEGTISVYYEVVPLQNENILDVAGDLAGSLGGGDGEGDPGSQDIRMLSATLPLAQLGKEAIDIRAGGTNGMYTAVLESQTLQIVGNQAIDSAKYKMIGVRIEVQLPGDKLVHETALQEDEDIAGLFQTLAVNLPDLPADAVRTVEKAAGRVYRDAAKPDDHSALIWYNRQIVYRFIANQTAYERTLADELDVVAGRTDKERVIVVTARKKSGQSTLRTNVDLLQSANRLHRGAEEARFAFNIVSGLFASRLEGAVLPGQQTDFMDIWTGSPADTRLFVSLPDNRRDDLVYMEELGLPETLVDRARDSAAVLLIPTRPTRIAGEDRWSWLEIDPDTFETISVMDTGERGSFAEYLLSLEPVSPTGDDYLAFMVGGFIGVSTSVWSISAFSLELDNYKEIIAAAKTYTYKLGQYLSNFMDNKDLVKLEYSMSPLKLKIVDADFDRLAKMFEEIKQGKKGAASADVVGFALGFNSGAGYYFKQVEKGQ